MKSLISERKNRKNEVWCHVRWCHYPIALVNPQSGRFERHLWAEVPRQSPGLFPLVLQSCAHSSGNGYIFLAPSGKFSPAIRSMDMANNPSLSLFFSMKSSWGSIHPSTSVSRHSCASCWTSFQASYSANRCSYRLISSFVNEKGLEPVKPVHI